MKNQIQLFFLVFLFMWFKTQSHSQNALLSNPVTGSITTQTPVHDFEFIYDGTDLVLAITGYTPPTSNVYFVDWNASTSTSVHDWTTNDVPNIKSTFASMIGDTPANIETWNMEVNPKTLAVYILFYSNTANNTFLVEVKNPTAISIVDLSSVSYAAVEYSDVSDYMMDIQVGSDQKVYGSVLDDQQTLDAHVGVFAPPFTHNSTMEARPTTVFKSNWGGTYVTWAPLERISFANVDGTDRLMGVTTCAPGFSIPVSEIYDSGNVLEVTEDFNVLHDPSKKVVALTQTFGTETTTYLFDLHDNFLIPDQVIRIGEKYLDGSQVVAGNFNMPAQEIRNFNGAITPGLTEEEATIVANGYEMIAKWNDEYHLMVIDDNDVLRLFDVTSPSLGLEESNYNNELIRIYPNPTSSFVQIELTDMQDAEVLIEVADISGKRVMNQQYDNVQSTIQIDLSHLEAGTYNVSIFSENQLIDSKSIIKK